MDLPDLVAKLQAIAQNNPERRIFVRGDKDLAYGRIMQVMGTITQGGFTKVALLAEQTAGQHAVRAIRRRYDPAAATAAAPVRRQPRPAPPRRNPAEGCRTVLQRVMHGEGRLGRGGAGMPPALRRGAIVSAVLHLAVLADAADRHSVLPAAR